MFCKDEFRPLTTSTFEVRPFFGRSVSAQIQITDWIIMLQMDCIRISFAVQYDLNQLRSQKVCPFFGQTRL